ncbi:MAG: DUF4369 domain-containing protein [Bacteroidetes bacterium]|nr:DUF4369 domain-containing protein [Bacteroidota bacterium]
MKFKSILQSIFITVLTCFTLLSCNGGSNEESSFAGKGFIIEGQFKTKVAGQKISLDELLPSGLKAFDSTKTDEEGHFEIKGIFKNRSFFLLRFEGGDIPIYLDSVTKLKVVIDKDHKDVYEISGSDENKKLKQMVDIGREHFKKLEDLQKRFPEMPTDDSTKKIVMDEYMGIMNGRRDKIMKMITDEPE